MNEEIKEKIKAYYIASDIDEILDYITNLQQENEELNFLIEIQNKREYRSKFLKDFQKEHGKNVFPDYDEVYKRYDDYKSRIDKAIHRIQLLQMDGEVTIRDLGLIVRDLKGDSDE